MYLKGEGYKTYCVYDGLGAVQEAVRYQPDRILLDILLSGMDGVAVCAELRRCTEVPIIFMSCKDEEVDKIVALGIGGDDYVVKPFSPREVVARIKAHLHRGRQGSIADEFKFGNFRINVLNHNVHIDNVRINLSGTEFEILLLLAKNLGVVHNAEQIF